MSGQMTSYRRLFVPAGICLVASIYVPQVQIGLFLFFLGMILLAAAAFLAISAKISAAKLRRFRRMLSAAQVNDAIPTLLSDAKGNVISHNLAVQQLGPSHTNTVSGILSVFLVNSTVVARQFLSRLDAVGAAREVFHVRGRSVIVSASATRYSDLVWRIDTLVDRPSGQRSSDQLAIPMLTASRAGTVLYMNEALRQILGGRRSNLDRIFDKLPLQNDQIFSVATGDGVRQMRVALYEGALGRLEVFLFDPVLRAGPTIDGWNGIESLPVALLRIDKNGEILDNNAMSRRLLRLEPDERVGFADLVEGLGRPIKDWLEETARRDHAPSLEFVRARRRSSEVFLQISMSRVDLEEGPGLVVVLNDATELKTLEAQFIQSQKMQAIGQLAGGVAHDFNNLLTAISGHCDLMMLRHGEGDPDFGDLMQIHQNANRAASLVGQLLAFSRKQTLTPEIIEVNDALNDLTHLLGRLVGEKVTLEQDHATELSPIRADKRQLEQVIMNLVVNARDAMPEGGTIRVSSHEETLKTSYERDHATVPPGDYVVIAVQDEGGGIPPDKLPKIFEPFFTTKRTGEGTGLGLSMVYGIVKQTGGYIFVDSIVGRGTTFTMFFPVFSRHEPILLEHKVAEDKLPEPSHGGGVVLLVEDEAPVRAFASRALKLKGYTVIEAESAEDALEQLQDPELAVDVFVTDVVMPGLDGPSWVQRARKDRPETKVVFVSGYAEENLSDQQARVPNSVFLPKPFSLSELAATVGDQMA